MDDDINAMLNLDEVSVDPQHLSFADNTNGIFHPQGQADPSQASGSDLTAAQHQWGNGPDHEGLSHPLDDDEMLNPPPPSDLPEFEDFPSWLPRWSRPPVACDYCTSTGFICFFTNGDETTCSTCKSLFRACTFESQRPRSGWLDTLGPVPEDSAQDSIDQVGTRPLFSHGATASDVIDEYMRVQPERTGMRFPRTITLTLKRWLEAHADHPYPTEEEKLALKDETGLSLSQISNWLANARRRGKVRPKRCASPSVNTRLLTQPINIKNPSKDHADMNPFERWKHSPPEKEAPLDLIKEAAATTAFAQDPYGSSSRSHSQNGRTVRSSGGSWLPSSASSVDAGRTSSKASTNGSESVHSHGSRHSHNSLASRGRRRRRTMAKKPLPTRDGPQKIYQCTFCTDTFHIKYDWTRHEKTLHLSLEKWICAPLGPKMTIKPDGTTACVYCGHLNPDRAHADSHAHYECESKDISSRTFYRKDHLRQHLRLVHQAALNPGMESWKSSPAVVRSRCGFCPVENPVTFNAWQERADHLAKHFRDGAKMSEWKGDHGFDPEIAAQVTNAMPPYAIGFESRTPDPFSASGASCHYLPSGAVDDEDDPFVLEHGRPRNVSTCWEILTAGLGRYARAQMATGVWPSDAMLQREARVLLFGNDDEWDSTAADNEEWLRLFKQAHGLSDTGDGGGGGHKIDTLPPSAGNDGEGAGSDAEHSSLAPPALSAFCDVPGIDGMFDFDEDESLMQMFRDAGLNSNHSSLEDSPESGSVSASYSFAPA